MSDDKTDLLQKAREQRRREQEAERLLKDAEPQMIRDWANSVGKKPD